MESRAAFFFWTVVHVNCWSIKFIFGNRNLFKSTSYFFQGLAFCRRSEPNRTTPCSEVIKRKAFVRKKNTKKCAKIYTLSTLYARCFQGDETNVPYRFLLTIFPCNEKCKVARTVCYHCDGTAAEMPPLSCCMLHYLRASSPDSVCI